MNNLLVMPMVIPILTAMLLVFFRKNLMIQRGLSLLASISVVIIGGILLKDVLANGIMVLEFSGWKAPYGIAFVGDSFSLLLVVTTSIITALCLWYAMYTIGEQREKMFFYTFVLIMVAGVNGSFLTGDIFNLFVCFEVMLVASYGLVSLGGERKQLKESITYVVVNVIASWFFLLAMAYLYGVVGTLNMAHLSQRIAELGQTPLLTTISIIFLLVFALKAGLLLFFWLPGSYSIPPTAIAAIFAALLTKVGIYALFRTFTLLFYHNEIVTQYVIGGMAAVTLILGSLGAIAYKDIKQIAAFNIVIAVGFILVGLAVGTPIAIEGSIYYLMHDMIVKALLYLLIGTIVYLTGTAHIDKMSGLIRNYPVLGWLFFIVMLSLAGIPPLSGFLGKILVGQGAVEAGAYALVALAFLSSIFVLYSLLKIFKGCFWGETIIGEDVEKPLRFKIMLPCLILTAGTFFLGLGPELLADYVKDAAYTLLHPDVYIEAVLGKGR